MKLTKYIAILLLACLSFQQCTLERVSFNEIYPENFFKNEEDCAKALTGLYKVFSTEWGQFYCADQFSYFVLSDFTSGMLSSKWTAGGYDHFFEHWWEVDGTDNATAFANKAYARYNEMTRITNTIKLMEQAPLSDNVRNKAIAEAKCLYGWLGYIFYDLFGPVPIATEEALADPTGLIDIPRLSDEEYSEIMIRNLEEAEESLPIKQDDWGRVTKGMAMMLQLKFHMINKNFTEAEKVARRMYEMEGSTYDLLPNYENVFDKAYSKNKEIIHAIPCSIDNPNYWLTQVFPWESLEWNQNGWGTFCMSWAFYDTYEKGDDRLKTILTEYHTRNGDVIGRGAGDLQEGCIPRKLTIDPEQDGPIGTTDHIVFRYADVLLSLAEAINENNNGPTGEAINLVNRIRNRVKLPALTGEQTASKEAFNKAILNERLHEFYAEGLSRTDQIRHGVFVSNSKKRFPNSKSDWYKVRFPIPSYYINESKGIVKQNPGY